MLEQVYPEGLQPMGRTHDGAGGKCEEDGGEAERSCYGLTTAFHTKERKQGGRDRGVGDEWVKLSLGKKSVWGEVSFLSVFLTIQLWFKQQ